MSRTAKSRRFGDRAAMLAARRVEQRARAPTDFAAMRGRINQRRAVASMRPLRNPIDKYPGATLRAIQAKALNWRGELRR